MIQDLGAWQPIETAPEEAEVLVWHRKYGALTAHILPGGVWGLFMPDVPMMFHKHLTPEPTHWMPLPAPPVSA